MAAGKTRMMRRGRITKRDDDDDDYDEDANRVSIITDWRLEEVTNPKIGFGFGWIRAVPRARSRRSCAGGRQKITGNS